MTRRHFTAITIAIITYNSADHIEKLIDGIPAAAAGLDTRIIVVDNSSSDDTIERVRRHPDVLLISAGGNTGYSGGINIAREQAIDGAPVAVLNPDLILKPGTLSRLVTELESSETIGIAVPQLTKPDGAIFRHLRREPTPAGALGEALFGAHWSARPRSLVEILQRDTDYVADHDVDWAGAALWVISPECDRAVGAWDAERYFLFSEETDYAYRARRLGFRVRYVSAAQAVHEGSGSGTATILLALLSVNRIRHIERTRTRWVALRFRAAVVVQHLLRAHREENRLTLKYLLSRRSWDRLPHGDPPAPRVLSSIGSKDGAA
ncbi:glycosyltransferase family 2 protein [Microlunatus elymi]|uniref:Glycosyltransferase family 2 protein n=1 Tax=Microlunatus elymi TaxID=2596828 RepID=A0A516PTY5_9ACTN|nr:glycosyltransferase family 2 protein [Microlunatus elymi]QDP94590.1 glycosyltransferase family 2 protein [Microlunatus elymi]